jgi:hypothetical protein
MKAETIGTFVEFIKQGEFLDLLVNQVIFRGQPVQGLLLPSIAREDPTVDTTEEEMHTLAELKLLGASLLPVPGETNLDLLVRAQHAGLQTRLLDWTSNSLAALWFACSDRRTSGDVYVYAMEADELMLGQDVYEQNPFETLNTRVLRPRLNNPRLIAQHGWFTLHRYSKSDKRFVALERNPDTSSRLYEYRIPAAKRPVMLNALDRHGVSARTLFPDLHGLCEYLNWKAHGRPRL